MFTAAATITDRTSRLINRVPLWLAGLIPLIWIKDCAGRETSKSCELFKM
jgi:hypothetical protein